ncbi:hypothetical protein NESM_000294900 [Novymonas esmeraldas]|uniref:Uncharacterized protein n=1 Tax=Novymonas esmeraldas TaxID=1808958 RepID=A0AAW0FFI2_9TRYP
MATRHAPHHANGDPLSVRRGPPPPHTHPPQRRGVLDTLFLAEIDENVRPRCTGGAAAALLTGAHPAHPSDVSATTAGGVKATKATTRPLRSTAPPCSRVVAVRRSCSTGERPQRRSSPSLSIQRDEESSRASSAASVTSVCDTIASGGGRIAAPGEATASRRLLPAWVTSWPAAVAAGDDGRVSPGAATPVDEEEEEYDGDACVSDSSSSGRSNAAGAVDVGVRRCRAEVGNTRAPRDTAGGRESRRALSGGIIAAATRSLTSLLLWPARPSAVAPPPSQPPRDVRSSARRPPSPVTAVAESQRCSMAGDAEGLCARHAVSSMRRLRAALWVNGGASAFLSLFSAAFASTALQIVSSSSSSSLFASEQPLPCASDAPPPTDHTARPRPSCFTPPALYTGPAPVTPSEPSAPRCRVHATHTPPSSAHLPHHLDCVGLGAQLTAAVAPSARRRVPPPPPPPPSTVEAGGAADVGWAERRVCSPGLTIEWSATRASSEVAQRPALESQRLARCYARVERAVEQHGGDGGVAWPRRHIGPGADGGGVAGVAGVCGGRPLPCFAAGGGASCTPDSPMAVARSPQSSASAGASASLSAALREEDEEEECFASAALWAAVQMSEVG